MTTESRLAAAASAAAASRFTAYKLAYSEMKQISQLQ